MPVFLNEKTINIWLSKQNNYMNIIKSKIISEEYKNISCFEVAPYVSKSKNTNSKCLMTKE